MATSRIGWGIVLLGLVLSSLALAGGGRGGRRESPSAQWNNGGRGDQTTLSDPNLLNRYLADDLGVEDVGEYNLTVAFEKRIQKLPEASQTNLEWVFSPQSSKTLGQIFRAFGRTEYNNAMVLGPAGVGKSFLIDQVVGLFSNGVVPNFLRTEIGLNADGTPGRYDVLREAFLGKTNVVLVNNHLLSMDNTKSGKAMSKEETRMHTSMVDLFKAARGEFKRSGRRTLFVFDEVATLPEGVQRTLKKILDQSGFKDPSDPVKSSTDAGFMIMAMTTPDEHRVMVGGDSAIERRYAKVIISEPTEEEAFQIVRKKSDKEWGPLYQSQVTDEAIRLLIRMRRMLNNPPLSMPANVLAATNDLFLSGLIGSGPNGELSLKDAQNYLIKRIGLSNIWFAGPNNEPPFYGFAERVKKRVIGQDEVVDKIAERLAAWARLGFGGDVPIFFLGGSSGSGKDTLLKVLSEELFGHDSHHLMFSLGGVQGFGIESIIEGPPRGNHSDNQQGLLVQALDNGPATGLIAFNEGKDAPSSELEKFKVFIESGEIRPKGKDSRVRPLLFPIFLMGQWGEEYFDGKSDQEILEIYSKLSQVEMEEAFLKGKGDGATGGVSRALLNRAKRTGGIFMLKPVAKSLYPRIVEILSRKIKKNLKTNVNFELNLGQTLIDYVATLGAKSNEGTRGLEAVLVDFTETAISKAMDQGLPLYDTSLEIEVETGTVDYIVVKCGLRVWKFEAAKLRRTKSACELKLLGG